MHTNIVGPEESVFDLLSSSHQTTGGNPDNPVVRRVVNLIDAEIVKINQCAGLQVYILIGPEETGKSTTINSFLGTIFRFAEDETGNFRLTATEGSHPPVAGMGTGTICCTVFPGIYRDTERNIVWVDTQGLLSTHPDPDEVSVAQVLLERIIQIAQSVSIICFNSVQSLDNLSIASVFGKLLDRIVSSQDVPIFCLFNRFSPQGPLADRYYSPTTTSDQKNAMALRHIRNRVEKLQTGVSQVESRIQARLSHAIPTAHHPAPPGAGVDADAGAAAAAEEGLEADEEEGGEHDEAGVEIPESEIESYINQYRFVKVLQQSVQNNRFGHIDPTDPWSIQNAKAAVLQTPPVDPSALRFDLASTERIQLTQSFHEAIENLLLPFVKKVLKCLEYPLPVIHRWEAELQHRIDVNTAQVNSIRQHGASHHADGGDIEGGDGAGNEHPLAERHRDLELRLSQLNERRTEVAAQQTELFEGPLVQVDHTSTTTGFFFSAKVKYAKPFNLTQIEERFPPHLIRKVVELAEDDFDIQPPPADHLPPDDSSGIIRNILTLKPGRTPSPSYHVSFAQPMRKRLESFALACVSAAIDRPDLTFLCFELCCDPVEVYFRCRPCDYEVDRMQELARQEAAIAHQIAVTQHELNEVMEEEANATLIDQLESATRHLNEKLGHLRRVKAILVQSFELWNKPLTGHFHCVSDEVGGCARVAEVLSLHAPPSHSIHEFRTLHDRITHLLRHPQDIPNHDGPRSEHDRETLLNSFLP